MYYKIWDRQTSINGNSVEKVIEVLDLPEDDELIIGKISEYAVGVITTDLVSKTRNRFGLPSDSTTEEVLHTFIDEQNTKHEEESSNTPSIKERVKQLKESINLATNKIDAVANREKNKVKCFIGTIIIVIIAIFLIIVLSNDSSESNNYTEDAWCRTYTNAYQKCHYSYWEKRCVCNQR